MEPKIGIILINYKDYAKRFLADCRGSLRLLNYPKEKFLVYIVDNASTPESESYLKAEYPEAIVLPSAINTGWAGGNNIGVARALADGCDDVVFLNMDVIVEQDWLKELVAVAGSREETGIVQSKILLYPVKDMPRINSLGNDIHFLMFGFCHGYGMPDNPADIATREVLYASGSSMYVKGEVIKKIGACDQEFFMYHDDLDYCLKARLAGFKIAIAPRSRVWHKYEFGRSVRQIYFMERNRLICFFSFYKWPTVGMLFPALLAYELGIFIFSIRNGYARAKISSWVFFFCRKNWKWLLARRRAIRALRKISDREMSENFVGAVGFQEIQNPLNKYFANPVFGVYWYLAKHFLFW
jgi:GT2 family glycosyltransferase